MTAQGSCSKSGKCLIRTLFIGIVPVEEVVFLCCSNPRKTPESGICTNSWKRVLQRHTQNCLAGTNLKDFEDATVGPTVIGSTASTGSSWANCRTECQNQLLYESGPEIYRPNLPFNRLVDWYHLVLPVVLAGCSTRFQLFVQMPLSGDFYYRSNPSTIHMLYSMYVL